MRIQKKLFDLKSSDVGNAINFDRINSPEQEEDVLNANVMIKENNNGNLNT